MKSYCFVMIGYGTKLDPYSGKSYNLDKTYQYIIKPVFEELGVECFRAIDKNQSGIIDKHMIEWIYEADYVVADITTLNPNVMYELGARHVFKPHTTLILAENNLMEHLPFDLNHLVVHKYEHLGSGIDHGEVKRMKNLMVQTVRDLMSHPNEDSPVYSFFPNLKPPDFEFPDFPDPVVTPLAGILEKAEEAKDRNKFMEARALFQQALDQDTHDPFIRQRLALVTYKSEHPEKVTALEDALEILQPLEPKASVDLETLGLMGAIHKRLFQSTGEREPLEKAIKYYEKGYVLSRDYYNGINLAFLLDELSVLEEDPEESTMHHLRARNIRKDILNICENLLETQGEKGSVNNWVLLTIAEAKLGLGDDTLARQYLADPEKYGFQLFEIDSFTGQVRRIEIILREYDEKHRRK